MNKLVLLSARYPLPIGEQFLETELPYLCDIFDQVEIVPTFVKWEPTFMTYPGTRPIPANAIFRQDIYSAINQRIREPNLKQIFRILSNKKLLKIFLRELPLAVKYGPGGIHLFLKVLKTASAVYCAFQNAYQSDISNLLFYGYWLDGPILGAALLEIAPTISRAHGYDVYWYAGTPQYRPLQRITIQNLERVFVVSDNGRNYLAKKFPDLADRMQVSRLGVSDAIFKTKPSSDGLFRIVTCSSFTPEKRIDLLIDALKEIHFEIEWTHFGDGPLYTKINSMAQNLPENIKFTFKGFVSNNEVFQWYKNKSVDVFINVSKTEGLPVSIMEAMSFCIPVIATDVGGIRELVSSKTGYLLPPNPTAQEIANSIINFRSLSSTQKEECRAHAWKKWEKDVNAEVQYSAFARELLNILKQKGQR